MKKKYNREEIEKDWVDRSRVGSGIYLCSFVDDISVELGELFNDITRDWKKYVDRNDNFRGTFIIQDFFGDYDASRTEIYLLRALSLNMLLDDNEEYFE